MKRYSYNSQAQSRQNDNVANESRQVELMRTCLKARSKFRWLEESSRTRETALMGTHL